MAALPAHYSISVLAAQQVKPKFEVASIKPQRQPLPSAPDAAAAATPRFRLGGRFSPTHATVESLVTFAYDVKPYQIVGGPDWMRRDSFHVDARAVVDASAAQIRLMVQSLLEDRFKLVVHTEQRDMRFTALVLARPDRRLGPYLQSAAGGCSRDKREEIRQRLPPRPTTTGGVRTSGCGPGLELLILGLSVELGLPVIDETGLSGLYFFEMRSASLGVQAPLADNDPSFPRMIVALEEQLGLKLESRRGPLKVLAIDVVQQPTEN